MVAQLASNTGSYIAIDAGGTRLRGYESLTGTEFTGVGVTHTNSLALDLARNISAAIPAGISEVDTLVLSLAAIPQSREDQELLAAAILQRVRFAKLVIASDTKAAALSSNSQADLTIAVGTGITAVGNLLVAITGSAAGVGGAAQFMFRKTGDAAYTVYRIA